MALPLPSPADFSSCTFSHCFCRWLRQCSPEIPSVGSGGEFAYIPDDAVDSPALSVLVGVVSKFDIDSSLRLHRFRVANSGRVLGQSGDALEILVDGVDFKPKNTWSRIRSATATRSPDGRSLSLCCFSRELDLSDLKKVEAPRAVELHMDLGADDGTRTTVSPLPCLKLGPLMPTFPVSAAGELWAPYLTEIHGPSRLVMQRLDKDAFRWVEVADLHLPHGRKGANRSKNNPVFQGFAVVGHIILLSLYPANLFFTFNCSTLTWASVITNETQRTHYVPIQKCAVYVEVDNTIYSLCAGSVYAYKLCQVDQHQHRMEPPIMVDRVYPFHHEGNGFLTHLGARVMCYVWIGEKLDCNCDTKHVLITTFRVLEDDCKNFPEGFVPKGIEVLHSTCRRLDMWPSKPNRSVFEFSILQVYEEFKYKTVTASSIKKRQRLRVPQEDLASSNVVESSKMLACCRKLFIGAPLSRSVMLERSAIWTNKALYIVCQVASRTAVFGINILNGKLTCHDKTLRLRDMHQYHALGSHFVSFSNFMYAVSDEGYINHLSLDTMQATDICRISTRDIRLICRVGGCMVALSDTLQFLYVMDDPRGFVRCCETFGIRGDLKKEVNLSGYVVLSNDSFMVSDAKSDQCFLIDLHERVWRTVKPYALQDRTKQLPSYWPRSAFLSERSVFAKGFIYTCSSGGLTAYELIDEGDSYYLGDGIDLQFSWHKSWEHERMCLDCIGENTSAGAIMFCVVQDDDCKPGFPDDYHPICFTTVQVKTEALHNGKLKPKAIGHVDIARSYIVCRDQFDTLNKDEPLIRTRRCFSSLTFSQALPFL